MNSKHTVLLVEDDPNDVLLVQRACKKLNSPVDVQVARDGQEAIDYLSGDGRFSDRNRFPMPNLILLDIKMPRKNGFDFLEWLRGTDGLMRIPVVMVSSSNIQSDVNKAYELGANAYLVKPMDFEQLFDVFRMITEFFSKYTAKPEVPQHV